MTVKHACVMGHAFRAPAEREVCPRCGARVESCYRGDPS